MTKIDECFGSSLPHEPWFVLLLVIVVRAPGGLVNICIHIEFWLWEAEPDEKKSKKKLADFTDLPTSLKYCLFNDCDIISVSHNKTSVTV